MTDTLLGCALTGRQGMGVELSPDYLAIYEQVCAQEG